MSEIVLHTRFSSGTSLWLSSWQISLTKRGQCCYFTKTRWNLTARPTAAVHEEVSDWMSVESEWVNGWLSEGREQITCSVTDRGEATAGSIDPAIEAADLQTSRLSCGCSSGLWGTARCWIISLHDCISGQIFYRIPYKELALTQYWSSLQWLPFFSLKWRPGMKSEFLQTCWQISKDSKYICYCIRTCAVFFK